MLFVFALAQIYTNSFHHPAETKPELPPEIIPGISEPNRPGITGNGHGNSGTKSTGKTSSGKGVDENADGIWKKDSIGWWFHRRNGTWPVLCWQYLDWMGKKDWYYFDGNGYMKTGWVFVDNKWYYLNESGAMQTGWIFIDNKWYYLNPDGSMAVGWLLVNGKWYYLSSDGSMLASTTTPDNYIVGEDGAWIP